MNVIDIQSFLVNIIYLWKSPIYVNKIDGKPAVKHKELVQERIYIFSEIMKRRMQLREGICGGGGGVSTEAVFTVKNGSR